MIEMAQESDMAANGPWEAQSKSTPAGVMEGPHGPSDPLEVNY